MATQLKNFIAPPTFADEEKTRRAALLHVILTAVTAGATLYVIVLLIVSPASSRLLITLALFPLVLGVSLLMRRGYVRRASLLFSTGLWGLITLTAATAGGLMDPNLEGYFVVILIAGLLLGEGMGLSFTGLSMVAVTGLFYMSYNELWSRPPVGQTIASTWALQIVYLLGVGTLIYMISRRLHQALGREQSGTLALLEERNQLRTLIDNLPDFIYFKDTRSRYITANQAMARLLKAKTVAALAGKTDFDFRPGEIAQADYQAEQALIRSGQPLVAKEERWVDTGNGCRWLSTTKAPLRDGNGNIVGLVGIDRDVTALKQAQDAIRESEALHRIILSNMSDAVFITDEAGRFVYICPNVNVIFGYSDAEVAEFGFITKLLGNGFCDPGKLKRAEEIQNIECKVRDKAGHEHALLVNTKQVDIKGGSILYTCRDITARKRAEVEKNRLFEEISRQREQLRALNRRLAETQEAERKALARELHDQVGQDLTALDLNLTIIKNQIVASPSATADLIQDRIDDSLASLGRMARRVRNVMADLRPPVLDDYGLLAALRWYGDRLSSRLEAQIAVRGEEPEPRLPSPVEEALFRITQEALTNVTKHAQADRVMVSLETKNKTTQLVIRDNGRGFEPTIWTDPARRQSWGLLTMTERAEAIGGQCRIESAPGRGTQVIVDVRRRPD